VFDEYIKERQDRTRRDLDQHPRWDTSKPITHLNKVLVGHVQQVVELDTPVLVLLERTGGLLGGSVFCRGEFVGLVSGSASAFAGAWHLVGVDGRRAPQTSLLLCTKRGPDCCPCTACPRILKHIAFDGESCPVYPYASPHRSLCNTLLPFPLLHSPALPYPDIDLPF
jgi:hypothetical protein